MEHRIFLGQNTACLGDPACALELSGRSKLASVRVLYFQCVDVRRNSDQLSCIKLSLTLDYRHSRLYYRTHAYRTGSRPEAEGKYVLPNFTTNVIDCAGQLRASVALFHRPDCPAWQATVGASSSVCAKRGEERGSRAQRPCMLMKRTMNVHVNTYTRART